MIKVRIPIQNGFNTSTDLVRWCAKNIGSTGDHLAHWKLAHWKLQGTDPNPFLGWQWDYTYFYFTNPNDATMFKLVWL